VDAVRRLLACTAGYGVIEALAQRLLAQQTQRP
jgi:hypothetical protein